MMINGQTFTVVSQTLGGLCFTLRDEKGQEHTLIFHEKSERWLLDRKPVKSWGMS